MNISKIDSTEFIKQYHANDLCIVDVRSSGEIQTECIEKTIHLPLQLLDRESFTTKIDDAKKVYLLCQSGRRAEMAIEKLSDLKHLEFVVITGGLNGLKSKGMPVATGSKNVIDLERQVRIAAGGLVFMGVVLSTLVHPYFIWMSAFVGAGLVFAGITNTCAMGMLIARMPWNRA